MTVTTTNNVRMHHVALAAYNRHDVDALPSLYHSDTQLADHATGQTIHGPEGVRNYLRGFFDGFSDERIEDAEIIGSGAWTVLRGRSVGTHDGHWGGLEPTGAHVAQDICAIVRWDAGKVAEEHVCYDVHGLLAQLGQVPPLAVAP